jgi:hypothetical protein
MRMRYSAFLAALSLLAPPARAADEVQLPVPAPLAATLAWRQDTESVLRVLRVPRGVFAGVPATAAPRRAAAPRRGLGRTRPLGRTPEPLADVPIAVDPSLIEAKPSLAANPRRQDHVVMAYVAAAFPTSPGTRCLVARSLDRGQTWALRTPLPTIDPASNCEDPVLAHSPDGSQLFAAFRETQRQYGMVPGDPTRFQMVVAIHVVVTRSVDDGRTWSAPVLALEAMPYTLLYVCPGGEDTCTTPSEWTPGTSFDRPSLTVGGAVPRGRGPKPTAGVVHLAATRIVEMDPEAAVPMTVVVSRSTNGGATWRTPQEIDAGQASGPTIVTQGPRIAAGAGPDVVVAWYHSGSDGFLAGDFEIRTCRSGNAGASWGPRVAAAVDGSETNHSLGPAGFNGRKWWTAMLPDVAVDGAGRAHVVYTRDPEPGSSTAEEGDIRHVASAARPYEAWAEPATVNDDGPGRAQGFATLAARRQGGTAVVEAVWEDTRLAPDGPPANEVLLYDVFHARLGPGGTWSANARVSDASSTQTRRTPPGRTSVAANDTGVVFAAWGDRRGLVSLDVPASDVYGSAIDPE